MAVVSVPASSVLIDTDALIAATAMTHQLVLLTGNDKQFSVIKGLKVEVFRA
jgi:predicted nucleic acid-binding protein